MLNLTWFVNAYGGSVTECIAYCACGNRAFYSQRLIKGQPAPWDSPVKLPGDSTSRAARNILFCPDGLTE